MKKFEIKATMEEFEGIFNSGGFLVELDFGDRKISFYADTDRNVMADTAEFLPYIEAQIDEDKSTIVWGDRESNERYGEVERGLDPFADGNPGKARYYVCPTCRGVHTDARYKHCPYCGQCLKPMEGVKYEKPWLVP